MKKDKPSGKLCPRDFFQVSEHVKYLEQPQVQALEQAFKEWRAGAERADSVFARTRMYFIFQLLRHTGARLGEVLSLDASSCFKAEGRLVRLGDEERAREVPLSDEFYAQVSEFLDSPMGCSRRGELFQVDPGYFRRICYARGRECGLPRELSGPQVLRNTRAVEMLRSGVPITVVKDVLGQSSLNLTAAFQQFSKGDMVSILQQSARKRTSARNAFVGHVVRVKSDPIMSEVVMKTQSQLEVRAVITTDSLESLKIAEGTPVMATVKAPLVNVMAGGNSSAGSACNRLEATVLRVAESPVLSEVTGRLDDGTELCALVSSGSAKAMELEPGCEIEFWFKALSVVLNTVGA